MAKSNKKVAVARRQTEEGSKGPVCCKNCEHANLIQYGDNPILALCTKKPDYYNKYGWEVDVASGLKTCKMHKACHGEKGITKLFSVRRHPMACYVMSGDSASQQHTGQKTA